MSDDTQAAAAAPTLDRRQQRQQRQEPVRTASVRVLFSPDRRAEGRVWPLERVEGWSLPIGRGVPADGVRLADPALSRSHGAITWDDDRGAHLVEDRKSHNGTFLYGRKVALGREVIGEGDVLRVGDSILLCSLGQRTPEQRSPLQGCRLDGTSAALRTLVDDIERVATSDLAVLIGGETGTGKELIAAELHARSGRARRGKLLAVNCAAVPENLIESELFGVCRGAFSGADVKRPGIIAQADRGTLFLDEVGEMPPSLQAKLLRVLETQTVRPLGGDGAGHTVDVRFVFATNRDLAEEVRAGRFREDLLNRINVWPVRAPALRERAEDLPALLTSLLDNMDRADPGAARSSASALDGEAAEALACYHWPGNVRELKNCLRSARLRAGAKADPYTIGLGDLPQAVRAALAGCWWRRHTDTELPPPPPETRPTEKELVSLMREYDGEVTAVARVLGKDRTQVNRWLKYAGYLADDFRPGRT